MPTKFPSFSDAARDVLGKFKSYAHVARGLSEIYRKTGASTVQSWVKSGTIPENYRGPLLALARRDGVALHPMDFVAYLMPLAS